ncbi:DUF1715-domain-containing protein, partial [Aulographum hederae CBS 113979]
MENSDPFDSLLNLEEDYYKEGYELGVADGSKAGRLEGRVFGMEKGFKKFATMGQLQGRAAVWAARREKKRIPGSTDEAVGEGSRERVLPPMPDNSRLEKHIETLYALAESASLSTKNSEEAVSEFDDRFKRAGAKVKVIEKIIREPAADPENPQEDRPSSPGKTHR